MMQAHGIENQVLPDRPVAQSVDELDRIEQEARMLLSKIQKQKNAAVRQAKREKNGKRKRLLAEVRFSTCMHV